MADHFSAVAERYAAFRPRYPAALVDLLVDLTPTLGTAWDVGCGSGQLSLALAERFPLVIATDLAERQLAAAPRHPRIEYRCAPAEASGLPDRCADLIVAAQAAHWFDWPRFVAEADRVARPHALVALVSYGNPMVDGEAGREVRTYHDDIAGPFWPRGRDHVENHYRDLVLPWSAIPAPPIAMAVHWTRDELYGYISSWSATSRLIAERGPEDFDALGIRLAALWPDGERRIVQWPLTICLARTG